MIRGVLFDLDGVLVRTDELHYRSWVAVTAAEGIPFDRAVNERLRGVARMDSLEIVLERATRRYSPAEKQILAARKNEAYLELLAELGPGDTLPGAMELVRELRAAGIRVAIASASKNARAIAERLGIAGDFDAIVDGHEIRASKPEPEVFVLAAERVGLRAAECAVIEDAAAGIEAARRAGMAVVAVGAREMLPDATCWFSTLAGVGASELLAAVAGGLRH